MTMKLGTALVAATTLPFTFLFARVIGGPGLALLATAVLASTRWLWQVGRVGLRFPFPPAFGAAIFYFLVKALVDRRRNDFLLCGLVLGTAQHSYTALRFAPLAVLACVGIALLADARRRDLADAPSPRAGPCSRTPPSSSPSPAWSPCPSCATPSTSPTPSSSGAPPGWPRTTSPAPP